MYCQTCRRQRRPDESTDTSPKIFASRTYLGFTGNRSDGADLLLLERVDDTTLPDVRIPDQTDRDLLLVRMEDRELSQELDQGSLSERVVDGRMESDGRCLKGEVFDPSSLIMPKYRHVSIGSCASDRKGRSQKKKEMSDSKLRHASRRASLGPKAKSRLFPGPFDLRT
jgi:hypothetical protein